MYSSPWWELGSSGAVAYPCQVFDGYWLTAVAVHLSLSKDRLSSFPFRSAEYNKGLKGTAHALRDAGYQERVFSGTIRMWVPKIYR